MKFSDAALEYCKIRNGVGGIVIAIVGAILFAMGARVRKTKPFAKKMMWGGAALIAVGGISYYFRESPFFCGVTVASNAMSLLGGDRY